MTTTRIRLLTVGTAAIALTSALAGCGSSKPGGGGASPGSASVGSGSSSCTNVSASTAKVTISNFSFHPSCVSVAVGTKVTFTNQDSTTHTATASTSGSFDSGNLKQGQSFTYTFTKAGTYSYICSIHQYMKGSVIVRTS